MKNKISIIITILFFVSINAIGKKNKLNGLIGIDYLYHETNNFTSRNTVGLNGKIFYEISKLFSAKLGVDFFKHNLNTNIELANEGQIGIARVKGWEYQVPLELKYNISPDKNPNFFATIGYPLARNIISSNITNSTINFKEKANIEYAKLNGSFDYILSIGAEILNEKDLAYILEVRYKNYGKNHLHLGDSEKVNTDINIPNIGSLVFSFGIMF